MNARHVIFLVLLVSFFFLASRAFAQGEDPFSGIPETTLPAVVAERTSDVNGTTESLIEQMRRGAQQITLSPQQHIDSLSAQISKDPTNASLYFDRSVARMDFLDWKGAMEDAAEATKLAPDNVFYVAQMAHICQQRDRYEQQARAIEILLTRFPSDVVALDIAAWFYATCPDATFRDGKKAVQLSQKACDITTDSNNLHTLAAALAEAGSFELAVETEQKAIALFESEKRTNQSVKTAYEKALARYRSRQAFHESRRSDVIVLVERASKALDRNDYDTCVAEASRAIELQGSGTSTVYAVPYVVRAYGYFKKNDADAVLRDTAEALTLNPRNTEALELRGRVYVALKVYDQAIACLGQAIECGTSDNKRLALLYGNRGLAYCRSGQVDTGLADLRKGLELDPTNPAIKENLQRFNSQK